MEYEDMVEDTDETPADELAELAVEPEKHSAPWRAAVLTGLLAGLIGAGGGAAAVYYGLKTQTSNMDSVKSDIRQSMSADMQALERRISEVETKAENAINRSEPLTAPAIDLKPLEARLEALENAAPADIPPEALSVLKAAQDDGFEWPDLSGLEARLSALEDALPQDIEALRDMEVRLDSIENNLADTTPVPIPQSLISRIEALENRPTVQPEPELVPLLALPKEAMLEAVENMAQGGFLERTLSKHVRVKDEDDPRTLINAMEDDIAKGRLDLALNKYERLPDPVRFVGQAWYDSVKQANVKASK